MIVDAEGKAQQRMLAVDRAIDDQWLVTDGLAPGDRVIVEGLQKVRPGMPVNAVPLPADKAAGSPASAVPQAAAAATN
jgi:membrane fusion protein (multidrug efflux system)